MTDVIEEIVFDLTPQPPKLRRTAAEQRESIELWNAQMAAWAAGSPAYAAEGGMPRAARWQPRDMPPPDEQRDAPPPGITPQDCPQCVAQRQTPGLRLDRWDHECKRRDAEIAERYRAKAQVVRRADPRTGVPILTLLAPDVP